MFHRRPTPDHLPMDSTMKITAILCALLLTSPAYANTFCHIETGQCLDPQVNDLLGQYLSRYAPGVTTNWKVVLVPDGTQHNAAVTLDGQGNYIFTNPAPVPAQPMPPLSVTAFKQRLTFAERAAILSSPDPGVKVFEDELNTAPTVVLNDPDVVAGINYLASLKLITPDRAAAILVP